jgi:hypothetical protein
MHHRVDPVVPVVDPGDRLVRLTEVGQVQSRRHHIGPCRWSLVEGHHIPAVIRQVIDHRPAELPATPGHCNPPCVTHPEIIALR